MIFVYGYFVFAVIGKQWLDPSAEDSEFKVDVYFPLLTSLEFFLYMGWLRSGEVMLNPFGDDDDDFEMNSIIDRNMQVSFHLADMLQAGEEIELKKDAYWMTGVPSELPHTVASEEIVEPTPMEGSTAGIQVPPEEQTKILVHRTKSRASQITRTSSNRSRLSITSAASGLRKRVARLSTMSRHRVAEINEGAELGGRVSKNEDAEKGNLFDDAIPEADETRTTDVADDDDGARLSPKTSFRGSVIKLILFDYIVFLAAYFTLSLFYRNIFSAEGRIRVKKRFPTRQHLIDAGILTEKEKRILEANESTEARETQGITLLPLCWANDVADQAISEGKLAAAAPHQSIVKAITEFRNGLQTLYCYDRVSFPLLYTQVATIFVYGYFFFTLFGKQWLDPTTASSEYKADFYFPLLTSFEVSFQLADGSRTGEEIEVDKDPYWELVVPPELPHTIASEEIEEFTPFEGSTAVVEVPSQGFHQFRADSLEHLAEGLEEELGEDCKDS
ncbi:unnamed protein product [Cyprideis torosa]|uniref:Bestrophin homolog n=1 Tax=Cyprideis torosa TaxID=163714 RepID=A0A7R8W4U6_9CRUS|nr:unnamed protein product [Cyprideis torosa]CAG0884589.1 unnamed protein product [Cyprideis torosa]